jgi:hypothetical protein
MGRWDHLADQKPQALREKVLDLVADELTRDLRAWPPLTLEWLDERLHARFEPVLARPSRPELDTLRVGCELARLELLREVERIDAFWRGPQLRDLLPTPLEEETAQFLVRFLVESALELQDVTHSRYRRSDLVALIERIEDRLLRGFRLRL